MKMWPPESSKLNLEFTSFNNFTLQESQMQGAITRKIGVAPRAVVNKEKLHHILSRKPLLRMTATRDCWPSMAGYSYKKQAKKICIFIFKKRYLKT